MNILSYYIAHYTCSYSIQFTVIKGYINTYNQLTAAPAVASFTNEACATGGVNPTDPLLFTCEVYEAILLQIVLPTGDIEIVSVADTAGDISLPTGFTAVSLNITEIDNYKRNFHLTISIANAFLLGGGEITCDDTTSRNQASARCPIIGKLNSLSNTLNLERLTPQAHVLA